MFSLSPSSAWTDLEASFQPQITGGLQVPTSAEMEVQLDTAATPAPWDPVVTPAPSNAPAPLLYRVRQAPRPPTSPAQAHTFRGHEEGSSCPYPSTVAVGLPRGCACIEVYCILSMLLRAQHRLRSPRRFQRWLLVIVQTIATMLMMLTVRHRKATSEKYCCYL